MLVYGKINIHIEVIMLKNLGCQVLSFFNTRLNYTKKSKIKKMILLIVCTPNIINQNKTVLAPFRDTKQQAYLYICCSCLKATHSRSR